MLRSTDWNDCMIIRMYKTFEENDGVLKRFDNINGVEDAIVNFCRRAFKNKYGDMWILPIYYDNKYINLTHSTFAEVGVELYPKVSNLYNKLGTLAIKKKDEEVMNKASVRGRWAAYKEEIHNIIHNDIIECRLQGIKPINAVVNGIVYTSALSSATVKSGSDVVEKVLRYKIVTHFDKIDGG